MINKFDSLTPRFDDLLSKNKSDNKIKDTKLESNKKLKENLESSNN